MHELNTDLLHLRVTVSHRGSCLLTIECDVLLDALNSTIRNGSVVPLPAQLPSVRGAEPGEPRRRSQRPAGLLLEPLHQGTAVGFEPLFANLVVIFFVYSLVINHVRRFTWTL